MSLIVQLRSTRKVYLLTAAHPLPPVEDVAWSPDVLHFPRANWDGVWFGYPSYCAAGGDMGKRLQWAGRAASRAWARALAAGDVWAALAPEQARELASVLDSLRVALFDKVLELNAWTRTFRALYALQIESGAAWAAHRDYLVNMAWDMMCAAVQARFALPQLFNTPARALAQHFAAHALDTLWTPGVDSREPPPVKYPLRGTDLRPWYPDPLPPERLVPADEYGRPDFRAEPGYLNRQGQLIRPAPEVARQLEDWYSENGSTELDPSQYQIWRFEGRTITSGEVDNETGMDENSGRRAVMSTTNGKASVTDGPGVASKRKKRETLRRAVSRFSRV